MPHYKNGTEVKVGDVAVGVTDGAKVIGVVRTIQPNAETCNMTLARLATIAGNDATKVVLRDNGETIWATCKEYDKVA